MKVEEAIMHVPRKGYTYIAKSAFQRIGSAPKGEERMGTKMEDMAERNGRAD
jgi:hypothetical protein